MKQPRVWILAVDGGAARVFRNTGRTGAHQAKLEAVEGGSFVRGHRGRHLGPTPGRMAANAAGDGRHGVTTHERQQRLVEADFVGEVLGWLAEPPQLAQFEHLIVAAPARVLGETRAAMPASLAKRVVHEVHADLVKAPIKDVEAHVAAHLLPVAAPPA